MTKAPTEIRSLARAYTEIAIQSLAAISKRGKSESARVAASEALLSRGWGKPAQILENGEDGPLQILVKKFGEESDG